VGKVIKNIFASFLTVSTLYSTHVAYKQDHSASLSANKKLTALEEEVKNLKSNVHNSAILSENLKTKMGSPYRTAVTLKSQLENLKTLGQKSSDIKEKLIEKNTEFETQQNPEFKGKILAELEFLKGTDRYYTQEIRDSIKESEETVSDLDECNQIREASLGFNISEILNYIDTLGPMEKTAFSFLVLNQIIFSSVVSIIYIFYGDYLIKKFNLENKYPKLSKVIALRRKFQSYYLLISIGWIISSVLIESIFCIIIL
jgi:hypothetical protein